MVMMHVTRRFEEIKTKRTKKYTDENGKKRQKTKTFFQTLNPFNKNKDGTLKTEAQIWQEINAEADAWLTSDSVE